MEQDKGPVFALENDDSVSDMLDAATSASVEPEEADNDLARYGLEPDEVIPVENETFAEMAPVEALDFAPLETSLPTVLPDTLADDIPAEELSDDSIVETHYDTTVEEVAESADPWDHGLPPANETSWEPAMEDFDPDPAFDEIFASLSSLPTVDSRPIWQQIEEELGINLNNPSGYYVY